MKNIFEEIKWSWDNPIIQELLLKYYREYLFGTQQLADTQVKVIIKFSELHPPAEIIDIGCGLGYHSISFAKHGFNVKAFDPGNKYLKLAQEQADKANVTVNFKQMHTKQLEEKERFSLAWAGGYCPGKLSPSEVIDDFKCIWNSLKPGGWFISTVAGKARLPSSAKVRNWEEKEDCFVLGEEWTDDTFCYENSWFIYPNEGRIFKVVEVDRIYDVQKIEPLLNKAGFINIETNSDIFGEKPAEPGKHFSFQCRKPWT